MSWRKQSVGGSCKGDPHTHRHVWGEWTEIGQQNGWRELARQCQDISCLEMEYSKQQITEKNPDENQDQN